MLSLKLSMFCLVKKGREERCDAVPQLSKETVAGIVFLVILVIVSFVVVISLSFVSGAEDLSIVSRWDGAIIAAGICEDEDCFGVVVAEESVGVVAAHEVHGAACVNHWFALAPLEEATLIVEHILHLSSHLLAEWQRHTQGGVTQFAVSRLHSVLIAVEHLWNTAHGSQQGIGYLHATWVLVHHYISNTVHIVVAQHQQDIVDIAI